MKSKQTSLLTLYIRNALKAAQKLFGALIGETMEPKAQRIRKAPNGKKKLTFPFMG